MNPSSTHSVPNEMRSSPDERLSMPLGMPRMRRISPKIMVIEERINARILFFSRSVIYSPASSMTTSFRSGLFPLNTGSARSVSSFAPAGI